MLYENKNKKTMQNVVFAEFFITGSRWSSVFEKKDYTDFLWWKKDNLLIPKDSFHDENIFKRITQAVNDRCGGYISEQEISKPLILLMEKKPDINNVDLILFFPRGNGRQFALELIGN